MENVITVESDSTGRTDRSRRAVRSVKQSGLQAREGFQGMLLNRDTVLTETTPQNFATAQGFHLLTEDDVAANPAIAYNVENFEPTQSFKPTKPYRTRLKWRDQKGNEQSKLLLTKPETVLTLVLRRGRLAACARRPPSLPSC